jgi:lipopolysaccharide assembly protein A
MSDSETTRTGSNPAIRLGKAHWATILLVVLIVILIAQNTHRTSIDFLWLSFDFALWFVLVITTIVGFLVGLLTARRRGRRTS